MLRKNSCIVSSIEEIESNLLKIINDDSFSKEYVSRGLNLLDDYFTNKTNSTQKIIEFLNHI